MSSFIFQRKLFIGVYLNVSLLPVLSLFLLVAFSCFPEPLISVLYSRVFYKYLMIVDCQSYFKVLHKEPSGSSLHKGEGHPRIIRQTLAISLEGPEWSLETYSLVPCTLPRKKVF